MAATTVADRAAQLGAVERGLEMINYIRRYVYGARHAVATDPYSHGHLSVWA